MLYGGKKFRLRRGLNPCLPDTGWAILPTELRSHMLTARQSLLGSTFVTCYHPQVKYDLFLIIYCLCINCVRRNMGFRYEFYGSFYRGFVPYVLL